MRVVLAGGGSAGHIEPALAVADALRQADPGAMIICLGTERGLETRLVPMRGYELAMIPAVPLPRSVTPRLLAVPGKLAGAVSTAAGVLDRMKADVVVGFGGYVATPGYLAARRRHVPIVVHEANPRPGLANKLGARLTEHVFTGHPATQLAHATYLGIPIRRQIADLDRLGQGDKARAHFGLRPDLPVLLVTGGSQGARSLNNALYGASDWLRSAGVQILHITGPRNEAELPPPAGAPYVAVPYVDRMDLAYAAADFALCRAGAMTCAELTAVGLPAAFVPLPIGNGEQRLNAEPIVAGGGGLLVDDADLSPEWIRDVLLPVLLDIDRVANMSEAAAALGRKDADRAMAEAIINVVRMSREQGPADEYPPAGDQPAQHFQSASGQPGPDRPARNRPGPDRPVPNRAARPAGPVPPEGSRRPGPPMQAGAPMQPGRPMQPGGPMPARPPAAGQPGPAFPPAPGVRRSPGAQGTPRFQPASGGQPMPGGPPRPVNQPPPGHQPRPDSQPMPGGSAAAASGEQWFEPRSRRQAEAWGSTDPAAPRHTAPSGTDGPLPGPGAPGGQYAPAPDAAPRQDGPPWPEAEPQPEARRTAQRRGQPRHGRHR
jgi:UDP-N-acetylglucosamine--N-acetylmuramyl-(pentapeptide) pyrophosphoryl-undecaprenol N-acetylglucosamine transferase